jgi:hypothetical protein
MNKVAFWVVMAGSSERDGVSAFLLLVSVILLAYSSTIKVEAICFSETYRSVTHKDILFVEA